MSASGVARGASIELSPKCRFPVLCRSYSILNEITNIKLLKKQSVDLRAGQVLYWGSGVPSRPPLSASPGVLVCCTKSLTRRARLLGLAHRLPLLGLSLPPGADQVRAGRARGAGARCQPPEKPACGHGAGGEKPAGTCRGCRQAGRSQGGLAPALRAQDRTRTRLRAGGI